MNQQNKSNLPEMSNAGIIASYPVTVTDELGKTRETYITGEHPLTIYLNKKEIVTLMTLGKYPELLTIGYLYNQGFIKSVLDIETVQVDWETKSAVLVSSNSTHISEEKLRKRTVTSGCGQGTMFGDLMENLSGIELAKPSLLQSTFYGLLRNIRQYNEVYKKSGAVHGCALCSGKDIKIFVRCW